MHKIDVARSGKPDAYGIPFFTATCSCGYSSGPCGYGTALTAMKDHLGAMTARALAALPDCPGSGSVPSWGSAGSASRFGTCLECLRRVPRNPSSHALVEHKRMTA
jgi:hypothetical protein